MSDSEGQAAVHFGRVPQRRLGPEPTEARVESAGSKVGRWMCRLSCLVCRIPLNRSGISATACFRGCSLSLLEGRLPARE